MIRKVLFLYFILLVVNLHPQLKTDAPEKNDFNSSKLNYIDTVINKAIENNNIPGAVVLIGRNESVIYKKAFGKRSVKPVEEDMTVETIFDIASITKPIATATSIMILVERGEISLIDDVNKYIPGFTAYIDGKEKEFHAKIYHLLTHTSGLPGYADTAAIVSKYGTPAATGTIEFIAGLEKNSKPGEKFVYSCLGYIILAEIVYRVSGFKLDKFAEMEIFNPLKMNNTFYSVPENLVPICAPTEIRNKEMIRGFVHDPLAWIQGGISGNAGLFSTADDIAVFSQMMLNKGEYNGKRILSPRTVETMTTEYPPVKKIGRGLGWDVDSDYMGQRGEIFTKNCYGHTGFTGTSLLIVPDHNLFLVVLTNRVHVDNGSEILRIRRLIANIVASAMEE
ncbi:MAG: serine hydrolase [Desulfobulbaceae bacterium]|nr:serine hydrolase [Desulfobulbaceae bacterium]